MHALAVAPTPPPTPRKAAGHSLSLALLLFCLALVALLTLWMLVVLRRGRRLREQAGRAPPTRYIDAWAEAGRRLEPPPGSGRPEDRR